MDLPSLSAKLTHRKATPEEEIQKIREDSGGKRNEDLKKGGWMQKQTAKKKRGWKPDGGGEGEKEESSDEDDAEFPPGIPVDSQGILPPFDPESVPDDAVVVAFGKRRTGKSWFLRDLLWRKRGVFNHGLVISKTKFNGFWQNYFPYAVVHGNYDPAIIENFLMLQLKILSENEKNPHKKINPRAVILLDDVVADHHIRYCDTLATLFYNGRHFKISVYLASQYVFGIPPGLRGNVDFGAALVMSQKRQRDQFAEDYADKIHNKDQFLNLLDVNTRKRHLLIINLSDPELDISEMYTTYVAQDVPLFEIGSLEWKKQVWVEGEKEIKQVYTLN